MADTKHNDTNKNIMTNNTEDNDEPIVIHPDKESNSDSDHESEFCDALENTDKPGVRDELSDIKDKKVNHDNRNSIQESSDHFNEEDDEMFKDAEDDEVSEPELNDAELRDRKSEELQRRKEAEDRLSEETKQVS